MTFPFGDGLLRPEAGKLHVYLLGPGVGESQVVVFPDGRCMVVDGCTQGGTNLPAALLEHLKIDRIEAFVLTHPDLDHLRGAADVVRRFSPRKIFRYSLSESLRTFIAGWSHERPANGRYRELLQAMEAIEDHCGDDGASSDEPCATTRPWTPKGAPYTVHFLAPTPFDRERARRVFKQILERRGGHYVLSRRFERIMSGETRLGDAPNVASLAVVIEWAGRKVLLAGDVANGKRTSPKSGWKGVLRDLDDPDDPRGHLVSDVDLVKVAHHGSGAAFSSVAWQRHASTRKTTAILTPFAPSPLPSAATLLDLRAHCAALGISSDTGGAFTRARSAGWVDAMSGALPSTAPCIAAVIEPAGEVRMFRDGGGMVFR